MASFYISAAHKSSGKTTLSIGLCAAIRQSGLTLQAFKKGPDYIDPLWLSDASGSPCYNLDFFTSSHQYILDRFQQHGQNKQTILVEGNMGLYDGLALDGSDSNAAMAKLLGLPVILVVDCSGTSRGIAPLLNGYQQFDQQVEFAGVILDKVAGGRHLDKLQNVIEAYTDFDILGAVPRNKDIMMTERHLGLIPSNEIADRSNQVIYSLAQQVKKHVDLDKILAITPNKTLAQTVSGSAITVSKTSSVKIAVAMDKAFGFYYPGDLDRFNELGVELVPFSPLFDKQLPVGIDGLFIGGGFPETQLEQLTANQFMRESIKTAIESGLPSDAECGGLMYLCRYLQQNDCDYPLCDVIPATVTMNQSPQGRGYVILESTPIHPWYQQDSGTTTLIKAHEFHYSSLLEIPENLNFAYAIKRGTGIDGMNDGIILHNLVASYSHLRRTDQCSWVDDFVLFVEKSKSQTKP